MFVYETILMITTEPNEKIRNYL